MGVQFLKNSMRFELMVLAGLSLVVAVLLLKFPVDPVAEWRPSLLFKQGSIAYQRRDYSEAERCWRADLDRVKREKGDVSANVEYFTSATWLGSSLEKQKRYTEAGKLMTEALEISKKITGPDYRLVPLSMYRLSCLYRKEGRLRESQLLCEEADRL
jgi:tetratricopeptide (TPR) repeat protein